MVAVGEAQEARSFLWELDGDYGVCGGGSKALDRFCGILTGSMVAVGEAQGARSFLWDLDGPYGCCGEAQGAPKSFLWELDGLYGCCGGGSRSWIVSVGA